MKPQAKVGLVLLAAGVGIWAVTPSHVTWGNHHYVKHALCGLLVGLGLVFLIVGSRD